MTVLPSVERRLTILLAAIAAVAVVGVLAIVPYRLYTRDIRTAQVNAHHVASIVHAALSRSAERGDDFADLVNRFQGLASVQITLSKLDEGEIHPAASSSKGSSHLRGTDLTFTAPPIYSQDGQTWLLSMYFDLSPMRRDSVRLIIDLAIAVVLGSAAFSVAVFFLIRGAVVKPLREITRTLERSQRTGEPAQLPTFGSQEMEDLARVLEQARAPHEASS
ncbi:MAG: hypothetical protein JRG96_08210 [Deltaproteobacteria bacterium]|nr:hypothetical protein [Deltaproteobacteria bacterium]MBW2419825.1 hypothetical protein [Deltaproteobacteria bacterium]